MKLTTWDDSSLKLLTWVYNSVERYYKERGVLNTSESDYKLYIHKADYKFKRPILNSRGRLYI